MHWDVGADDDDVLAEWLRHRTHRSAKNLVASTLTEKWIQRWNEEPRPFVWHKTADEILENFAAYCERISDSGH